MAACSPVLLFVCLSVIVTVDMHMFVLLSVNRSVYSLVFPIFKYCPSVCQSICKFSKEVTTVTCLIWPNLYCLNRFSLYCLIHFFKGNRYMYLIQSNSNYNQNIFFNISYSIKINHIKPINHIQFSFAIPTLHFHFQVWQNKTGYAHLFHLM